MQKIKNTETLGGVTHTHTHTHTYNLVNGKNIKKIKHTNRPIK